jgi:hypothetical protein
MKVFYILSMFLLASCLLPAQQQAQKVEFRTLVQDDTTFHTDQPIVFAIQSKHEEDGILSVAKVSQPLVGIDYTNETVICLVGGKRQKIGTKLTIDSLVQNGTSIKVCSHESQDAAGQFAGNIPCHIVAIKKAQVSLDFDQDWFKAHSKN